jgi:class 3 adenylate cyclase
MTGSSVLMPTSPADASASRRELDAERASYAPAHVQRRARDSSAPFSGSEHATLEAAVLFADISGFTPLSSKLAGLGAAGAEALSRLLNDYFGRLLAIVAVHGGEPLKFAGDALIALWPAGDGSGALALQRAAGCALAVQRDLHGYDAGAGDTLSLRIAVAHGRVNAAQLRSGDSWHFVVGGVPVNELAQAQACAQPGDAVLTAGARAVLAGRAEKAAGGCCTSSLRRSLCAATPAGRRTRWRSSKASCRDRCARGWRRGTASGSRSCAK